MATHTNSATPYEKGIQTHESLGAILIQTTTDDKSTDALQELGLTDLCGTFVKNRFAKVIMSIKTVITYTRNSGLCGKGKAPGTPDEEWGRKGHLKEMQSLCFVSLQPEVW